MRAQPKLPSGAAGETSDASGIAAILGLPHPARVDDLALVAHVEKGLPSSAVEALIESIDPAGDHVEIMDLVPKATYFRRKSKGQPLTREQSERIVGLARVIVDVLRLYGHDSARAMAFLSAPHPLLKGRAPLDMAKESTFGADVVLKLLGRADAGVAA
jgi:putative toxin-antitoxin system antitoxin component (TIGR02293 family)